VFCDLEEFLYFFLIGTGGGTLVGGGGGWVGVGFSV